MIDSGTGLQIASEVYNMLNTTVARAVTYPASTQDVQTIVQCLHSQGIPAVPRSGGHSYEGYSVLSNAVTLSLNNMTSIQPAADMSSAVVGGGTRLGQLYYTLWTKQPGTIASGGTCPNVGVGGLFLGKHSRIVSQPLIYLVLGSLVFISK